MQCWLSCSFWLDALIQFFDSSDGRVHGISCQSISAFPLNLASIVQFTGTWVPDERSYHCGSQTWHSILSSSAPDSNVFEILWSLYNMLLFKWSSHNNLKSNREVHANCQSQVTPEFFQIVWWLRMLFYHEKWWFEEWFMILLISVFISQLSWIGDWVHDGTSPSRCSSQPGNS